ncbi:hypothetical protein [Georgenia sp. SUBG003]|uniref:hypothetical protein n=1 Tax=Georgenia sp. SUBG003 TaxID=1497974 RepID=UPI003AB5F32B
MPTTSIGQALAELRTFTDVQEYPALTGEGARMKFDWANDWPVFLEPSGRRSTSSACPSASAGSSGSSSASCSTRPAAVACWRTATSSPA